MKKIIKLFIFITFVATGSLWSVSPETIVVINETNNVFMLGEFSIVVGGGQKKTIIPSGSQCVVEGKGIDWRMSLNMLDTNENKQWLFMGYFDKPGAYYIKKIKSKKGLEIFQANQKNYQTLISNNKI